LRILTSSFENALVAVMTAYSQLFMDYMEYKVQFIACGSLASIEAA